MMISIDDLNLCMHVKYFLQKEKCPTSPQILGLEEDLNSTNTLGPINQISF